MEGETLRSEVGEEAAVVVVLTELAAGGDVRDLGEGGEEVVSLHQTGLVLHPAGVRGELGLDQDQGGDDQAQYQESHHGAEGQQTGEPEELWDYMCFLYQATAGQNVHTDHDNNGVSTLNTLRGEVRGVFFNCYNYNMYTVMFIST